MSTDKAGTSVNKEQASWYYKNEAT